MHEVSLCRSLIDLIEAHTQNHTVSKVKTICIEVGKLACVDPSSMEFAFASMAKNTIAEGATLEFITVEGTSVQLKEIEVE